MEDKSLRFLYGTRVGRCVLKLLIQPGPSRIAGKYLDSRHSRWLIRPFIRRNRLDLTEYENEEYGSFNAFFIRQKREAFRRIDSNREHLISPCDGFLTVHRVSADSRFQIKGIEYSLEGLLADAALARRFEGGYCFIFRLTPRNYHRYCYIDGGTKEAQVVLPGVLHCVRPVACDRYPVYMQNSREYALIHTENLGDVVQMEVGAMLVGRICNHPVDSAVRRGQEKGYFQFGGSTIVALFEKGRIAPDERMCSDEEVPVRMGEKIGTRA